MITDWHEIVAIIAGIITLGAVVPYLWDMLRGTTRPNIISWGLWTLIHIIFISAQWSSGASWSIVLPVVEFFTVGGILVLGIFGYGYKKYGVLDGVCLVIALGAIVLWQITSEPLVALLLSVAADLIASIPTLTKSYLDPESETPLTYFLIVIAAFLAGLSSTVFDTANLIWPIYIFLINGSVLFLILLGRRHLRDRAKKAL